MKTVILAIAFLAATVTAADVCQLQCSSQNGTWSGNTSVVIQLGGGVEIAYDVEYQLLVVVNTNQNIAIAVSGNFFVILNFQTGGAIVVDINSGYAVYVNIEINFKNSDGSINYTRLVAQIEVLISRYSSISSSTSGSFNFQLLIVSYYSGQFDLSVIFSGNAQLVQQLQASYGVIFRSLQAAVVNGSLGAVEGIWGFLVVVIDINTEESLLIVEVFKLSIEAFHRVEIQLVIALVQRLNQGIAAIQQFTFQLSAYITTSVNASISGAISYVNDVRNNPVNLNVTIGGSSYALVISRIDSVYVLRLSIQSRSGRNLNVKLVLLGDVLLIYNLNTNVAVALYRNYFIALNVTSDLAIVANWSFLGGLRGNLLTNATLQQDILNERYARVRADVKAIVKLYSSRGAFSVSSLAQAVQSGSEQRVASIVGSANARRVLILYGGFFGERTGTSVGGIVVGVFGNRRSAFSLWFGGVVDFSAKSSGVISWGSVVSGIIKLGGNGHIGSGGNEHIGSGGHSSGNGSANTSEGSGSHWGIGGGENGGGGVNASTSGNGSSSSSGGGSFVGSGGGQGGVGSSSIGNHWGWSNGGGGHGSVESGGKGNHWGWSNGGRGNGNGKLDGSIRHRR